MRGPRVPTIRPEIGARAMVMTAIGRVYRPARMGENPRSSWRYSVLRNRKPPRVAKAATAVIAAPENGTDLKNRRSMRGSSRRPSHQIKPISDPKATANAVTMIGDPHPRSGASMMP